MLINPGSQEYDETSQQLQTQPAQLATRYLALRFGGDSGGSRLVVRQL